MSVVAIEVLVFEKIRSKHTLMRPHIDSIHKRSTSRGATYWSTPKSFHEGGVRLPTTTVLPRIPAIVYWLLLVFGYVPAMKLWPLSLLSHGTADLLTV